MLDPKFANAPPSFSFSARIRVTSPIRSRTADQIGLRQAFQRSRGGKVIQSLNHTFKASNSLPPGICPGYTLPLLTL